jgi:hypothetical protein
MTSGVVFGLNEWICSFKQKVLNVDDFRKIYQLFGQLPNIKKGRDTLNLDDPASDVMVLYEILKKDADALSFKKWDFQFINRLYKNCNRLSAQYHPDHHQKSDKLDKYTDWTKCINKVKEVLKICRNALDYQSASSHESKSPRAASAPYFAKKEEKEGSSNMKRKRKRTNMTTFVFHQGAFAAGSNIILHFGPTTPIPSATP